MLIDRLQRGERLSHAEAYPVFENLGKTLFDAFAHYGLSLQRPKPPTLPSEFDFAMGLGIQVVGLANSPPRVGVSYAQPYDTVIFGGRPFLHRPIEATMYKGKSRNTNKDFSFWMKVSDTVHVLRCLGDKEYALALAVSDDNFVMTDSSDVTVKLPVELPGLQRATRKELELVQPVNKWTSKSGEIIATISYPTVSGFSHNPQSGPMISTYSEPFGFTNIQRWQGTRTPEDEIPEVFRGQGLQPVDNDAIERHINETWLQNVGSLIYSEAQILAQSMPRISHIGSIKLDRDKL